MHGIDIRTEAKPKKDQRDTIQVLEEELKFLEDKGYDDTDKRPWGVPLIFEDSPTCPNVKDKQHSVNCSDCVLARFVPLNHLSDEVPCRHIALNDAGETVNTLYKWGTLADAKLVLHDWLVRTIERLKAKRARLQADRAFRVPDAT